MATLPQRGGVQPGERPAFAVGAGNCVDIETNVGSFALVRVGAWRRDGRVHVFLLWNGIQKMANLGAVLKAEISRLARKEVRAEVEALRKASGTYRREIAELKRQVVQLERKLRHTAKSVPAPATVSEESNRFRFSAKGLRSLRTKLGLSAADFGKLAGVSGQSIYHWEQGKSVPRKSQLPKLAGLRGLGKREALQRLGVE